MRWIGAFVALAALAAVVSTPVPARAFRLHIGPYHIAFPFYWHHHRHHHIRPQPAPSDVPNDSPSNSPSDTPSDRHRDVPNDIARAASRQDLTATLLYPRLALPAIDAAIFSPSEAPRWPFDYQSIFATAFAKVSPQQGSQQCQQQPDVATATIARIRAGLATADTQMPVLQKLGSALRDASASLAASCTATVPAQPVARSQFMATQIGKLASAIGAVQQPLTDFQQSLDDEQRARFAVMISVPSASRQNQPIQNCGGNPAAMGASIDQIDHAVQPTGAQRDALTDLKQALNRAAGDFDALCQTPMPPTAPSRLEAIKARLDATSQAISSIQSALADFEAKLSDDQKTRFEAMSFAAR